MRQCNNTQEKTATQEKEKLMKKEKNKKTSGNKKNWNAWTLESWQAKE